MQQVVLAVLVDYLLVDMDRHQAVIKYHLHLHHQENQISSLDRHLVCCHHGDVVGKQQLAGTYHRVVTERCHLFQHGEEVSQQTIDNRNCPEVDMVEFLKAKILHGLHKKISQVYITL